MGERREARGREATQRKLEEAAVEIIGRDGILAGLNLREVADRAGVNRGNIYHYFGSRQELLRSALNSRIAAGMPFVEQGRGRPFVERKLRVFQGLPAVGSSLLALLTIDGDQSVDPLPDLENSLADLEADVAAGELHPDHDLLALQIAFQSINRGYEILRTSFATRAGVPVEQLDQRVRHTLRLWLERMADPPSTPSAPSAPAAPSAPPPGADGGPEASS